MTITCINGYQILFCGLDDPEKMFQFLIGKLKTAFIPSFPVEFIGFQFLIGKLKTLIWFVLILYIIVVMEYA